MNRRKIRDGLQGLGALDRAGRPFDSLITLPGRTATGRIEQIMGSFEGIRRYRRYKERVKHAGDRA